MSNYNNELKTVVVPIDCSMHLWTFWSELLPKLVYSKYGMSVNALIDDSLAFCTYCLDEFEFPEKSLKPYEFDEYLWHAISDLGGLHSYINEVSEVLDDRLQNARIYQLYLQHSIALLTGEDLETSSIDVNKDERFSFGFTTFSFHNYSKKNSNLFCQNQSRESIRKDLTSQLAFHHLRSTCVDVEISQATHNELLPYLEKFDLTLEEVIPIILTTLQRYIPIDGSYTDSFRNDLFSRRLVFRTVRQRCLSELATCEALSLESDTYARIIKERLSVVSASLKSGQSLADYLSGEVAEEAKNPVEYAKTTKLAFDVDVSAKETLL